MAAVHRPVLFRMCVIGLTICLMITFCLLSGPPFSVQTKISAAEHHHRLCVLVPFRDRFEELLQFVPHISRFLQGQNIQHTIFVVNQVDAFRFNRASLLNAGFVLSEEEKDGPVCDYLALHDVDLLPLSDQLNYSFPALGPYHVSAPGLHPRYDYPTFIGGILLISRQHFRQVNGLSNNYWGWGLEDDEFFARLTEAALPIQRPSGLRTNHTNTFRHVHSAGSRKRDTRRCYNQYEITRKRDRLTGLSTVQFRLKRRVRMLIDDVPLILYNVALDCDTRVTPWCDCSNAPSGPSPSVAKVNLVRDGDVIVPILPRKKKPPAPDLK